MAHTLRAAVPTGRAPRLVRGIELKLVLSSLAALAAAYKTITPDSLEGWILVCAIFVVLDGLTGMIASSVEGHFKSHLLRVKSAAKLGIYLAFGTAFWVISTVMNAWYLMYATCSWILITEFSSIRENVHRLQKKGVKLGPVEILFNAIDDLLAIISKLTRVNTEESKE